MRLVGLIVISSSAGLAVYGAIAAVTRDLEKAVARRIFAHVFLRRDRSPEPPQIGPLFGIATNLGRATGNLVSLSSIFRFFERWENPRNAERLLKASNFDERLSTNDLLYARVGFAVLLAIAVLPSLYTMGAVALLFVLGGFLLGYKIPVFVLGSYAEERKNLIKKSMMKAVDLLTMGIEAGMSLDRVMRIYAERFNDALAEEFRRAFSRIDIGQARRDAFLEMAEKSDVDDLKIFTSAVLQAEKLGTPLSLVLSEQSRDLKTRHRQWVKEKSAKVPVKMLFPLVGLILPGVFVILLGFLLLKFFGVSA